MSMNVEKVGVLGRKVTVKIPNSEIEHLCNIEAEKLSKTVKLEKFRPGKVPLSVVKQRFGKNIRDEVVAKSMDQKLQEAFSNDKTLLPVEQPKLDEHNFVNKEGSDLEFTVSFDVYPEISIKDFGSAELEKHVAQITEEDITKGIDSLQNQFATFAEVERAAAKEDRVTIDFEGMLDGKPIQEGQAAGITVDIGSGGFLADFEAGLEGMQKGEEKDYPVKFPDDYSATELQGKTVDFHVKVHKVEEKTKAPLDESFAEKIKVEDKDPAKINEQIRTNMEGYLEAAQTKLLRDAAFEWLVDSHDIELPAALIDKEVKRIEGDARAGGRLQEPAEVTKAATRSVKLGLLLRDVIEKEKFEVDKERLSSKLNDLANAFGGDLNAVKRLYDEGSSGGLAENLKNTVLTEQVADLIISKANVKEKQSSFEEITNKSA